MEKNCAFCQKKSCAAILTWAFYVCFQLAFGYSQTLFHLGIPSVDWVEDLQGIKATTRFLLNGSEG